MKGLLLAFVTLTSWVSFAQVTITLQGESADLEGQTITVAWDGVSTDVARDFIVTNNTGASQNLKIRREWINPVAGFQDYLCWGNFGGIGDCYPVNSNSTWTCPNPAAISDGGQGLLNVHIKPNDINGTALYRYCVLNDGGTVLGCVDIQFVSTAGLKEPKTAATITAYPNPATSVLTVAANGLDSYTIRMTDVLGKVIYEEAANGTKKIDVSDFKNGVYLVTVLERGAAIQTRRVVVKH